jgi:hypothetical protein
MKEKQGIYSHYTLLEDIGGGDAVFIQVFPD